ncbi:MAG: TadE/TadG family type IV pilus assembly protein, partial [Gammaproteobacteria bacterium]
TVEFAIVAPVLLLLMLATAELGKAFFEYNTLTKAVRDGARYLSGEASNAAGIIDLTQNCPVPANLTIDVCTQNLVVYGNTAVTGQAVLNGLSPSQVNVTAPDAIHVQVTAAYPYAPLFASGIPTFGFGSGNISVSFTMSASVTMRAL